MNRTALLISGAVCWSIAAIDAAIHLANGDLLVPSGMAAIFALWVGLRAAQHRLRPVAAN
jgi:hypothetical protein